MAASSPLSTPSTMLPMKRRREDSHDIRLEKNETSPIIEEGNSGKKKERKRTKKIGDGARDSGKKGGIDESIGKMDNRLLADFFARQAKRHGDELTALELNDIFVPEHAFVDTSSWQSTRDLENLPSFLKEYSSHRGATLSKASEENGAPHTLVITLAGLRAADITRTLRPFQNRKCAVAKLFAKHIKLNEAQLYVKKTRIGIGVGTPVRLTDLVNSNALGLGNLKRIVIDGSYVDQKKRRIFDMKEMHFPLLQFLNRADLRNRYNSNEDQVQILVF